MRVKRCACLLLVIFSLVTPPGAEARASEDGFIKWFSFGPTNAAMSKALELHLKAYDGGTLQESGWDWISLLAYLAASYGGSFEGYRERDLTALMNRLAAGEAFGDITADMKYYSFYDEAYRAVLAGFVGPFRAQARQKGENGEELEWADKYGLKAFSPIAGGYYYTHFDDFGDARSFGYKRRHLGHDLMTDTGTPVIAVESGVVETLGWNYYGGWRIGIRSYDGKRYYYYAHLRRDKPYVTGLGEGQAVKAGDVIGYVGQTGYSRKENYNGVKPPHLHFGMQIIFDESQKDSANEIWIDLFELTRFLQKNKSTVAWDSQAKDQRRVYDFFEPDTLQ